MSVHRITLGRPNYCEMPVQVEQPRDGAKQQVMSLARDERTDRENVAGRPGRSGAARRVVGSRHDDSDTVTFHAVIGSKTVGGRFACNDDARQPREQTLLEHEQRRSLRLADPALQRSRMMNKADGRSEEHTSELQSPVHLVCRLLLEKKK